MAGEIEEKYGANTVDLPVALALLVATIQHTTQGRRTLRSHARRTLEMEKVNTSATRVQSVSQTAQI